MVLLCQNQTGDVLYHDDSLQHGFESFISTGETVNQMKHSISYLKEQASSNTNSKFEVKRKRGQKRRGRKKTSEVVLEMLSSQQQQKQQKQQERDSTTGSSVIYLRTNKERHENEQKPVSKFFAGQSCAGKVVQVTPLGIYVDVGCHSDGFCHVSKLSDEFVEAATSLFSIGDQVKVRVANVNCEEKQIILTMQSDMKLSDEKKSQSIRRSKDILHQKKNDSDRKDVSNLLPIQKTLRIDMGVSPRNNQQKKDSVLHDNQQLFSAYNKVAPLPTNNHSNVGESLKSESQLTPAELKRARKLARRADRRAQLFTSINCK